MDIRERDKANSLLYNIIMDKIIKLIIRTTRNAYIIGESRHEKWGIG